MSEFAERFNDWNFEHTIELVRLEAGETSRFEASLDTVLKTVLSEGGSILAARKPFTPIRRGKFARTIFERMDDLRVDQEARMKAFFAAELLIAAGALDDALGGVPVFGSITPPDAAVILTTPLRIGQLGAATLSEWWDGISADLVSRASKMLALAMIGEDDIGFEGRILGLRENGFKDGLLWKTNRDARLLIVSLIHAITNHAKETVYAY